jgi:DNA-binding NarL/FixJ family response regulator
MISNPEDPLPEILIVGNKSTTHRLRTALEHSALAPIHVVRARSIAEARDRLDTAPPDAIVLDLGRPDASTPERLGAMLSCAPAPVVVVSEQADERLRREAMACGAYDCVSEDALQSDRLTRSLAAVLDCGRERAEEAAKRGSTSLAAILNDVCRELHARFSADLHMVVDVPPSTRHVAHGVTTRAILNHLLLGLVDACERLRAGRLELQIRSGETSTGVLVSIEARPDIRLAEYRSRVLGLLVEQRDDPLLGHDLDAASVAIREADGSLFCREGDDGRLLVQVSLPAS